MPTGYCGIFMKIKMFVKSIAKAFGGHGKKWFLWGEKMPRLAAFSSSVCLLLNWKTNIAAEETRIYSCDMRVKN